MIRLLIKLKTIIEIIPSLFVSIDLSLHCGYNLKIVELCKILY